MQRVVDSSRYSDTFKCNRKRFIGYEADGTGYVPANPGVDLLFGLGEHAGLEVIMKGGSFEEALPALKSYTDKLEGSTLYDAPRSEEMYSIGWGLLRSYTEFFLPSFLNEYEVLSTELELINPLNEDFVWATRLDLPVRRKSDGVVFNVNYKTTSYPSDLFKGAQYNLQLLMEGECTRKWKGEHVGGTILIGLDKGTKKGPSEAEKRSGSVGFRYASPFAYGYGDDDGVGGYDYSTEWKKGWERLQVWEKPGLEAWWEFLKTTRIPETKVFITPAINHDTSRVESVKRQVISVERRIAEGLKKLGLQDETEVLDEYFPQNFANCLNDGGFGKPCPFFDACHVEGTWENRDSVYVAREPNHPIESMLRGGETR